MSNARMMAKVKDADVVIVNPTHYAVALRYDRKKAEAPFVIALGYLTWDSLVWDLWFAAPLVVGALAANRAIYGVGMRAPVEKRQIEQ